MYVYSLGSCERNLILLFSTPCSFFQLSGSSLYIDVRFQKWASMYCYGTLDKSTLFFPNWPSLLMQNSSRTNSVLQNLVKKLGSLDNQLLFPFLENDPISPFILRNCFLWFFMMSQWILWRFWVFMNLFYGLINLRMY